jgi:hypothetical protein
LISTWPLYPTIYEINTRAWLFDLSAKTGRLLDLRSVRSAAWAGIAGYGFDAVWLMGVWQRSRSSIAISNRNNSLLDEFKRALPDFQPNDNIGSAYSVRDYVVDQPLGGAEGLAVARRELARRGIRLILDLVLIMWRWIILGSATGPSISSKGAGMMPRTIRSLSSK